MSDLPLTKETAINFINKIFVGDEIDLKELLNFKNLIDETYDISAKDTLNTRLIDLKSLAQTLGVDLETLISKRSKKTSGIATSGKTYQNPENHAEIWGGKGKRPRWLVARLEQGENLDDFAI